MELTAVTPTDNVGVGQPKPDKKSTADLIKLTKWVAYGCVNICCEAWRRS